jgi:hypothetical protein
MDAGRQRILATRSGLRKAVAVFPTGAGADA